MEKTISSNISVDFLPWSEMGLSISSLYLHEELGGSLAYGNAELITLITNDSLDCILRQYTGHINIKREGGNIYEIDIFIINRKILKNSIILEFVCAKDKRFFTELKSLEYTDITNTLNSLYPGKIDIRSESDINNELPLRQFMETDQSFCIKLALSFKKNTIFAFGWEGFMLKDLKDGIDSKGEKEEYDSSKKTVNSSVIFGGVGAEETEPMMVNYDYNRFVVPWDPWKKPENDDSNSTDYSAFSPINSSTLKYHDNYITLGKEYTALVENYVYNQKLLSSNLFATKSIRVNDIPRFKLGDVITYKHLSEKDIDYPFKTFLVKSNTFQILLNKGTKFSTGSTIKWDSDLVSLVDAFGELLPETDITDKIYEG